MAVALKWKQFAHARDLASFCADGANSVTTIVSITKDDTSGGYTLFYTS